MYCTLCPVSVLRSWTPLPSVCSTSPQWQRENYAVPACALVATHPSLREPSGSFGLSHASSAACLRNEQPAVCRRRQGNQASASVLVLKEWGGLNTRPVINQAVCCVCRPRTLRGSFCGGSVWQSVLSGAGVSKRLCWWLVFSCLRCVYREAELAPKVEPGLYPQGSVSGAEGSGVSYVGFLCA